MAGHFEYSLGLDACSLVALGFEYVTGTYHDGGKIFRKRT